MRLLLLRCLGKSLHHGLNKWPPRFRSFIVAMVTSVCRDEAFDFISNAQSCATKAILHILRLVDGYLLIECVRKSFLFSHKIVFFFYCFYRFFLQKFEFETFYSSSNCGHHVIQVRKIIESITLNDSKKRL